ncbi:MAG: 3-deoxy-manno-octulosonate cytidylyltransferase [Phycisphaerales bacterium JB047]
MAHHAIAIIPARLGSTRFPAKALAHETGKPLVVHACEQASKAACVSRVVVATDAAEIKSAVESHGYEAVLTRDDHPNGTSRLAQAAKILKLKPQQIVVNVQGDEPEIEPDVINGAVTALTTSTHIENAAARESQEGHRSQWVGTVASLIDHEPDAENPNIVKVAVGLIEPERGVAQGLYFSRAKIPYNRDQAESARYFRHVGIYAYTVSALNEYMTLEESPLERVECLEQLRWLEHGYTIAVAIRPSSHSGIDTPEQYRAFVERHAQKNHRN